MMDNGIPPMALLSVLLGATEDKAFAAGRSLRTAVDMDIEALLETGGATFELLRSLAGRRLESLDHLFLTIDSEGLFVVLQSLFYVAASEYKDGPGDLWAVKGELPSKGIPTQVKLSLLNFACNAYF